MGHARVILTYCLLIGTLAGGATSCSPEKKAGILLNVTTTSGVDRKAITALSVTVNGRTQSYPIGSATEWRLGIETSPGSKTISVTAMAESTPTARGIDTIEAVAGQVKTLDIALEPVVAGAGDAGTDGPASRYDGPPDTYQSLDVVDAPNTSDGRGAGGSGDAATVPETGGAPGTGGVAGTGGTGGVAGSGGAGSAGTTAGGGGTSLGGNTAAGGTTASGGNANVGGNTATGGTVASGGTTSAGGTVASGGTTGSGGMSGAPGTDAGVTCGTSCSSTQMIDDFEDGDIAMCPRSGWIGSWWFTTDGTATLVTPPSGSDNKSLQAPLTPARGASCRGLHMEGPAFTSWGAMLELSFNNPDSTVGSPVDLTGFTGLSFWIRGSGSVRVGLSTTDTVARAYGGTCVASTTVTCGRNFGALTPIPGEWKNIQMSFSSLSGGPSNKSLATSDLAKALTLDFQFPAGASFDLWLDDVAFLP